MRLKARISIFLGLIVMLQVQLPSSAEAATTVTFNATGSAQDWIVPSGVSTIFVQIAGASGGNTNGGLGESITATIAVSPGDALQIYVGSRGTSSNSSSNSAAVFGGGALGSRFSGAGGGASDIRVGSFSLAERILVAGGGGGGSVSGAGGNAGSAIGLSGISGYTGATGGAGGTQSGGGLGGTGASACGNQAGANGTLGSGGAGATASAGGAGGGGGYYGGGGGGSGCNPSGGGGGSSFADPNKVSFVTYGNVSTRSDGFVKITYTLAFQTSVVLSIPGGSTTFAKGATITFNANVTSTSGGKITFFANGKRIPGCISKVVATNSICLWKSTIRGSIRISVEFRPSTLTDIGSTSELNGLVSAGRSNFR